MADCSKLMWSTNVYDNYLLQTVTKKPIQSKNRIFLKLFQDKFNIIFFILVETKVEAFK